MRGNDFIGLLLLAAVSMFGMMYMELGLERLFLFELFVILFLTIALLGLFYELNAGKRWPVKVLFIFFIVSLVNSTLMYTETRDITAFTIFSFVSIIGMIYAVTREWWDDEDETFLPVMPVYHVDEQDLVAHMDTYELEEEKAIEQKQKMAEQKAKAKKKAAKKTTKKKTKKKAAKKTSKKTTKKKSKKKAKK